MGRFDVTEEPFQRLTNLAPQKRSLKMLRGDDVSLDELLVRGFARDLDMLAPSNRLHRKSFVRGTQAGAGRAGGEAVSPVRYSDRLKVAARVSRKNRCVAESLQRSPRRIFFDQRPSSIGYPPVGLLKRDELR